MHSTHRLIVVAGMLALSAAPSAAQKGGDGDQFYISAGFGWGQVSYSCGGVGCVGVPTGLTAVTGYVQVGAVLSPSWHLGLEGQRWNGGSGAGNSEALSFYGVIANFYPNPDANYWIKAGLGYMVNVISIANVSQSAGGVGGSIGLGYDWRPGDGDVTITPYLNYSYQLVSGSFSMYSGTTLQSSLLQAGVAVGYGHY